MKNECPNCGNSLSGVEAICKYCGTKNDQYIKETVETPKEIKISLNNNNFQEKNWSFGVFILLLIFCWPIAVLYALINSKK